MRNCRFALGLLALTAAAPAIAQDTGRGSGNAVPPSALGAYLHHQPSAKDVEQREIDSGKKLDDTRQRHEQTDVDELYKEIMRDSAPGQGTTTLPKR